MTAVPHTSPLQVTRTDLPLACPRPDAALWNKHPRVYLPIEKTGQAVCPYCDAHYQLIENPRTSS